MQPRNNYEKAIFSVLFVWFLLQALPLDWQSYRYLFSINWLHIQYQDIFNLAHYTTRFSAGEQQYSDWLILLVISAAGIFIIKKDADYDKLYYWLRVILRYRLALALLAYGFVKFFPLLAPYPSLSQLNTPYGHFNRWKIFSLSLGIVPSYELFLGLVELFIAALLLYRRTASIGAFFFLIFCGNIFMSNLAYEGGDQVYSLLLIVFAFGVLIVDLNRIIRLLLLQLPTAPATFKPTPFRARLILKSLFILLFVVIYGFKAGNSKNAQYPLTKGLPGSAGLYNVSTFSINRDTIPYSVTHTQRWQDVVFEDWNTISIRSGNATPVDSNNQHRLFTKDEERLYELEGANWRQYYSYEIDSAHHQLLLKNKHPQEPDIQWTLQYTQADNQIILSGLTPGKDSVYAVLDKLPKKYLLEEAAKGTGRNRKLRL